MSTTTLCTVVLPTLNRPRLLRRAVASVFAQTSADFELIVVDDGSTDDPLPAIAQLHEPRAVCLRRPHQGVAAALNAGIRAARGELVSFLDDDDELLPDFLSEIRRHFDHAPRAGFGWTGREVVTGDGPRGASREEPCWTPAAGSREATYRLFLRGRRIGACGLTVRRSCLEAIDGFDEQLAAAVDTDLLIRLARRHDFLTVPRPLVRVHRHPGPRLSTSWRDQASAYEAIIGKHLQVLAEEPDLWRRLYYKTGWLHYRAGDRAQGRSSLRRALRRAPLDPKVLGALLLYECAGRFAARWHAGLSRWWSNRWRR